MTPHSPHLSKRTDLITPDKEIRAGFIALALERNRRATPFIEQARALRVSAMRVESPADLLIIKRIRPALLTAAGLSNKATSHLNEQAKLEAIRELIEKFL